MRRSAAVIAVVITGLALAGQAAARTPPGDAPVSTAPAGGGAPLSTRQQIDQYLTASPEADGSPEGAAPRDLDAEKRVHGEVTLAVGSNGYRGGSVSAVIPLGESSSLALSYGRSKGGHGYGGHGPPGYGYDGLGSPLETDAACVAGWSGQGGYDRPAPAGPTLDSARRCPDRLRPND